MTLPFNHTHIQRFGNWFEQHASAWEIVFMGDQIIFWASQIFVQSDPIVTFYYSDVRTFSPCFRLAHSFEQSHDSAWVRSIYSIFFLKKCQPLNKWNGLFCVYLPSIHWSILSIWFHKHFLESQHLHYNFPVINVNVINAPRRQVKSWIVRSWSWMHVTTWLCITFLINNSNSTVTTCTYACPKTFFQFPFVTDLVSCLQTGQATITSLIVLCGEVMWNCKAVNKNWRYVHLSQEKCNPIRIKD